MKKSKIIIYCLSIFLIVFVNCSKSDDVGEKYPDFSKNIINVSKNIVDIKTDLPLGQSQLNIVGNYLLVCDIFSLDEGFHFFDKNNLKYIGSGGRKGQGPGEIIRYKNVKVIPNENDEDSFFVFDYSQVVIYKYHIDSLLSNKRYLPKKVVSFKVTQILSNFIPLNDSVFLGLGAHTTSSSSFVKEIIKLNIKTNRMGTFGYQNPEIKEFGGKNTHSFFAGAKNKNRYVRSYLSQDLMTICDIEGNLVCNVYGPEWDGRKEKRFDVDFFNEVALCRNYIIAAYNGGVSYTFGENKRPRGTYAQKFLIFDLDGNYQKTLDVGEEIRFFCIDEDSNRLFLSLRDRDVLSYVDLKGILD